LFCCVILQGILLENLKLIARPQCFDWLFLVCSGQSLELVVGIFGMFWGVPLGSFRQQRFFNVKGPLQQPQSMRSRVVLRNDATENDRHTKRRRDSEDLWEETMQMSCLFLSELLN